MSFTMVSAITLLGVICYGLVLIVMDVRRWWRARRGLDA